MTEISGEFHLPATPVGEAPSPARRSWAKRTAIMGFLVLAIYAVFFLLPGVRQAQDICGRLPDMTAFELARSADDVRAVFADIKPGCQAATIKAMNQINRVDLPLFMMTYSLFIVSASLFESAKSKQRRWLWGLLAAPVALLGDLLETGILFQMTDNLPNAGDYVAALVVTTWIKWIALAGFAGLVSVLALQQSPRRWVIGGVNAAGVILTVLALFNPHRFGAIMALTLGFGWFVLWGDALRATLLSRFFVR